MPVELSPLRFAETLVFRGVLRNAHSEYPVHELVVTRYRHRYPSDINFSFQLLREERDGAMSRFASDHVVEFVGTWEYIDRAMKIQPPHARLLLRLMHGGARSISGVVEQMDIAAEQLPFVPTDQTAFAWITPTNIALRGYDVMIRYRSGELHPRDFAGAVESFLVPTRLGTLSLSLGSDRESVTVEGEPAHVEIPSVAIHGAVSTESLSADVSGLMSALAADLKPLECVLSLFSRRHVRAYRFAIQSSGADDRSVFHETNRYVQGYSTPAMEIPLVDPRSLTPSSVAEVVDRLLKSRYRQPIEQSLNFLLAYWQSRFIEERVAAAFTAFEALVNGMAEIDGTGRSLAPEQFSVLRERVKGSIRAFTAEEGLPKQVRARLYAKVEELQRAPLSASAEAVLTSSEVEWSDLWPAQSSSGEMPLSTQLGRAYGLRSALFHAGRIPLCQYE